MSSNWWIVYYTSIDILHIIDDIEHFHGEEFHSSTRTRTHTYTNTHTYIHTQYTHIHERKVEYNSRKKTADKFDHVISNLKKQFLTWWISLITLQSNTEFLMHIILEKKFL